MAPPRKAAGTVMNFTAGREHVRWPLTCAPDGSRCRTARVPGRNAVECVCVLPFGWSYIDAIYVATLYSTAC